MNVVRVFHERNVGEPALELGGRVLETRIIRGQLGEPEQYVHLIQMSHRSRMRFDKEMRGGGRHWIHVESSGPMPHETKSDAASTSAAITSVASTSVASTSVASTSAAVAGCVHPVSATQAVPAVSAAAASDAAPQAKRARSAAAAAAAAAPTSASASEWQPATVTWNGKPAKALVMRVPGSAPVMYHVRWNQGRHGYCESSEAVSADDVAF